MLVLQRKRDERILINPGTPNEIVITVVNIKDSKIRLGFEAGDHVLIMREELLPLTRPPKPSETA